MILTYNDKYSGGFPAFGFKTGDVVVLRGERVTGRWLWRKRVAAWVVKVVRRETSWCAGHIDIENYWRVAGVFHDKGNAETFADEIKEQNHE